jgi:hypothetical protein
MPNHLLDSFKAIRTSRTGPSTHPQTNNRQRRLEGGELAQVLHLSHHKDIIGVLKLTEREVAIIQKSKVLP